MINRRKFVTHSALGLAGMFLSGTAGATASELQLDKLLSEPDPVNNKIMDEVLRYRKIDAHAHVYFEENSPGIQIDLADRLGIEKLVISRPMAPGSKGLPSEFRNCNDLVLKCMKQYPDRFLGEMTLNPTYPKESMEEIKRCMDQGMVGLKLYNHVKINDPLFYPVIEKFIDLNMIILMHVGIGKARITYDAREPKNVSVPEDFAEVSKRYPEAMFQLAHLAGGEDWEDACKAIKHCPNVYVDISGSNNEAGVIDFAVNYLGEDRVLFGCDNSFYQGVGHVFAAELTEQQRKKIFFDNHNNILRKAGRHVN